MIESKVTRCGWFAFEGLGRPFEAWTNRADGWQSHGRAFTYKGAMKKARAAGRIRERQPLSPMTQNAGVMTTDGGGS